MLIRFYNLFLENMEDVLESSGTYINLKISVITYGIIVLRFI